MSVKSNQVKSSCVIPALLAVAFAAALAWGFSQRAKAEEYFYAAGEYMDAAHSVYERCAGELADNIYDMQTELSKLRIAASARQRVLALEDIGRSGAAAVSVMSRLPRTHEATEELMTFLVRTGDYARCLSRRVLAGDELSSRDLDQLEALYACCASLADDLQTAVQGGGLSLDVLEPEGYYADGGDNTGLLAVREERAASSGGSGGTAPEYPSLVYDGPFSESTEKASPKGLTGSEVTMDEALAEAIKLTNAQLAPQGISQGKIPYYLFEGERADGTAVTAAVTIKGGHLLWYMSSDAANGSDDSQSEQPQGGYIESPTHTDGDGNCDRMISASQEFLASCGYDDMAPTYVVYYSGAALLSFVWQYEDVRVYNDLIKVWVDTESMEVVGIDANNYLFSHRQRHLPKAELTAEEARGNASKRLSIDASPLALIPLTPNVEALCYELHGFYGDGEYLVYINALTGAEEQIFRVLGEGAV